MTRILVVDNYDSFTWNLVQLFETLGSEVDVVRNDDASVAALVAERPDGVVLSPGPGTPERAGIAVAAASAFGAARVPLLGVCLGHQAIGVAFGARMAHARVPRHGRAAAIRHDGAGVFRGLPAELPVGLYHSLVLEEESLPVGLVVSARSPEGEVMGIRHAGLPIEGVQFHPESVLSEAGATLVANFLAQCRGGAAA